MAESGAPLIKEKNSSYNALSDVQDEGGWEKESSPTGNSKRNKVKAGILCFLLFFVLVGPLLAIAILVPTSNNCTEINKNINIYSNDTVIAQQLKSCQTSPTVHSVTTPNHVDVFAVDCKRIVRESEIIEDGECTRSNVEGSTIEVFLDVSICSYSNYLLKESELEVNIDIAEPEGVILVCVFTNMEAFRAFENETDKQKLDKIVTSAQKCDTIDEQENRTTTMTQTFTYTYVASEDAYHYGGIKTLSSENLDSVKYTFDATRLYYNPVDYIGDKIDCFSDSTECNFNKTSSDTCVLFHASTSSDVPDGFNVVRVTARYNFEDWRFILTMSVCALLLSILLSLTCMSLIYILV